MNENNKREHMSQAENMPIGIFDSGIGGVTVLKEIIKVLPNEEYIYYSDSKNNPYGDKEDKIIIQICDSIVKKLIKRNCKAIVIACNTASAKAVKWLREKYPEILFVAIEPAYKMVHDYAYESPTLIMATKGTIESEKFNLLYQKYDNHKTEILECVGLADIIEKGSQQDIEKYLLKNLNIYKGKIKNVVLGCTHYPLVKKEILEVLGKEVVFFDGSLRLAIHLKELLQERNLISKCDTKTNVEFIDSSNSKEKENRFREYLKAH